MHFTIVEVIQLAYNIPSMIFMLIVGILLLQKILTESKAFQNEFYPMFCYRIFNDVLYNICILLLLKFPSWLVMPQYFLHSVRISSIYYVFAASTFCVPFVHTIFLSAIRYVAIYHPMRYTRISSQRTSIILCSLLFLISFSIGLPTLAFPSMYIYSNYTNSVLPTYKVKSVAYYNFCYAIVFYGITVILSAIFNIANLVGLSRNNKKNNNKNKKSENVFAFYTFFTLFTTCLMEAYFCCRISDNYLGNKTLLAIANYSVTWIGDLETFGNFYFLIFINTEIKAVIKETLYKVCKIKCNSSSSNTIKKKNIQDSKNSRCEKTTKTIVA
uniref:G_PROTEIN_RECEP_F1_2 domain-containing protein n=1 Tax=Strongyloides venezuelensis TaxID=75913 RepID=A0A0K0F535_STRVS